MKRTVKLILSTFVVFSIIFACENDKIEANTLSKNDIINIGKLHNEYLSETFSDFNWNSKNKFEEAKNQLMSIDINEIDIETQTLAVNMTFNNSNIGKTDSASDLDDVKAILTSSKAIKLVDKVYANLNKFEHHDDLVNSLIDIKLQMQNSLSSSDFEIAYSYAVVLEQSSYFWKPIELGGSGEGYEILILSQDSDSVSRGVSPCTKAVVAADGAGAATAFLSAGIGGWIAGAINPAGMAASVAVSAAGASVYAGLTHPKCEEDKN